jgi:LuxR family maltose regulon positive regulatory protein
MTVSSSFLPDKLNRPQLGIKTLVRERLYQQLDQSLSSKVTMIIAPAGYGKTVLLTDWMTQRTSPTSWLSIDENDNHLHTFIRNLALAVETLFHSSCRETLSLANGMLPSTLTQLTESILAEIGDLPKSIVLILDNYHALSNPEIHVLITALVEHLSERLHLIIGTRSVPPLPLARWRLNGQLSEIHASDLRFTQIEGRELLQLFLGVQIPADVNEAIAERTEGWAAGLRLTALSLKGQSNFSKLSRDLLGQQRYIMDYLMDEVFTRQTPGLRDLLLKSAILDWMSEPLVEALTRSGIHIISDVDAEADPASMEQLISSGLFIDQVTGARNKYRYHELFRDLLIHRLKERATPQAIAVLHLEASRWLEKNGYFEEAIRQALAAGEPLAAARVVEGQVHALLNQESKSRLEILLGLLPRQLCEERAPLLIARAWIMHFEHRLLGFIPFLERAEQLLQSTEGITEAELSSWRGDIMTLRSEQRFWHNQPREAVDYAFQAIAVAAPTSHFVRGLAMYYHAVGLHVDGESSTANHLLYEYLQQSTPASASMDARLLLARCCLLQDYLQLEQLQSTAQSMLRLAEANGILISKAWGHYFLGKVSYEKNDLRTAQFHFLAGASLRHNANGICTHECLAGLALIYAAQGKWQRAAEMVTSLIEFDSNPLSEQRLANAHSLQVRLALMSGDHDTAWHLAQIAKKEPHYVYIPLLEMAAVTSISVLLARHSEEKTLQALEQAKQLQETAESISSTLRLVQALTLQALAYDALGDGEHAIDMLKQALELAQWEDLQRTFVDFGQELGNLLSRLLISGRVNDQQTINYGEQLLAAFRTARDAFPNHYSSSNDVLVEPLTVREVQVLDLLARRLTDREIAETLVISPFTVRRHVRNLSEKLEVHGRRAVVERARTLGLITPLII